MRRLGVNSSDWRMVQVFLSHKGSGIYEVELTMDGKNTRCNCPTFKSRHTCRHVTFVQARMDGNGFYPILVHPSARDEDLAEQVEDKDRFRKFVLKYAKIEVV